MQEEGKESKGERRGKRKERGGERGVSIQILECTCGCQYKYTHIYIHTNCKPLNIEQGYGNGAMINT